MKYGVALIVAALANTALAVPPPNPSRDIDLFCSQDLSTADSSKELWKWGGPGRTLDHFLQRRKSKPPIHPLFNPFIFHLIANGL
jgi:hypothetical protein